MKTKIKIFFLVAFALSILSLYAKPILTPTNKKVKKITVTTETSIPQCTARGFDNKIILITSKYCPHCKEAKKIINPIIKKLKLKSNYAILDITKDADRNLLEMNGIRAHYLPTLIINCKAYVGLKSKEKYTALFKPK
jgi:glutaredoxin